MELNKDPHQDKPRRQRIRGRQVADSADHSHDDVEEGHGHRDHAAEGDAYQAGHCPGCPAAPLLAMLLPAPSPYHYVITPDQVTLHLRGTWR